MDKPAFTNMEEYIARFDEPVRVRLEQIRSVIRDIVPEAEERISYQMPTFYLNGNLVHFAAFDKHIGLYQGPSGISAFEEELAPYKHAKGSVQFPLDQPLPIDLVKRIASYRADENLAKSKPKRGTKRKVNEQN